MDFQDFFCDVMFFIENLSLLQAQMDRANRPSVVKHL